MLAAFSKAVLHARARTVTPHRPTTHVQWDRLLRLRHPSPAPRSLCSQAPVWQKPAWADVVGCVGFGLIGLQWMMSDMLSLRAVAIVSSTSMVLYNLRAVARPLWIPVGANIIFISINAIQIGRILLKDDEITFAEHEQLLFESTFERHHLSKRQVRELLSRGTLEACPVGDNLHYGLAKDGSHSLLIILDGVADVRVGTQTVATLSRGDFVGEMSFLLQDDREQRASVVAREPTRTIRRVRCTQIWTQQLVCRLRKMDEQQRKRGEDERALGSQASREKMFLKEGVNLDPTQGYHLLEVLLGDGFLASLVLWHYRKKHRVESKAILLQPDVSD
ncbi:hypothetical protein AB1Y20_019782 [Prymnesium parvum]|uniref:Cyclic nucleotide-binding domain-containing protein n=1 Tax=Prymnesium parvum TaxID=97485 RepID=A0AB34JWV9_PRYPA